MLVFPQLSTGASVQYPAGRKVSQRSVQSATEDGTIISLADTCSTYLRWKIMLEDLTDQEATAYSTFFEATQGSLQPFLFLDPAANLLIQSEDFTESAWTAPAVAFDSAVSDPFGGSGAQRAHNQTSNILTIAQQSQIPSCVETCFSVYLRSDAPASATLTVSVSSQSQYLVVETNALWQRCYLAASFPGATGALDYTIQISAGCSVDLYGPQVDAQVSPSHYVATSGSSGVYPSARFDAANIERIVTGPNRNTCVMYIRCNLPGGE